MNRPEVSVTMPSYNRADLIGRAIESVMSQTMPSWELIVVDDGSTDTTLQVAESYASLDRRIRVYRNHHNTGVSCARNRALRHSHGRFITPLDSDDWYDPTRLERLLAAADDHGADVLADDLQVVRDDEDLPLTKLSVLCAETLSEPLHIDMAGLLRRLGIERDGLALGLTKPLIRRKFLVDHNIEYDTTLQVGEDYWLLADCVAAGATFVTVPDALYYYRIHAQQTTKASNPAHDILNTRRRLESYLTVHAAADDAQATHIAQHHIRRIELLANYSSFIDSLKSRRLHAAAGQMMKQPGLLREAAMRMPLMIERRRRARRGDPYAYDQLFGPHKSRRVPALRESATTALRRG